MKTIRVIAIAISIVLALFCGFISILAFYHGVVDPDRDTWSIFFVFALGFIGTGGFLLYVYYKPPKIVAALHKSKSYAVEALRLGGKQMLCDIIKWTIIIIVAAVVFLIVHHILCDADPAAGSRSMGR
ncbi:MAG: hypothetical protein WBL85_07545 [Sedimentisphaerales bacterium]